MATFAAGLSFGWDGWFSKENQEAHVQEVIDMLVNIVFFIYFGAALPFNVFLAGQFPIWKLAAGSLLILVFRRLPFVLMFYKLMDMKLSIEEASIVGWFGPIGVGCLYYMGLACKIFPDREAEIVPLLMFVVFASVVAHGIMAPFVHLTLVQLGTDRPPSFTSTAMMYSREEKPGTIGNTLERADSFRMSAGDTLERVFTRRTI